MRFGKSQAPSSPRCHAGRWPRLSAVVRISHRSFAVRPSAARAGCCRYFGELENTTPESGSARWKNCLCSGPCTTDTAARGEIPGNRGDFRRNPEVSPRVRAIFLSFAPHPVHPHNIPSLSGKRAHLSDLAPMGCHLALPLEIGHCCGWVSADVPIRCSGSRFNAET